MSEIQDEAVMSRRPSLDELFASEPFLSPTMKAKRLFDRPQDDEGNGESQDAVVAEAVPTSTDYPTFPPRLEPQTAFAGSGLISITAARAIMMELSEGTGRPLMGEPENISRLRALKERMLTPWLRNIGSELQP